MFHLRLLHHDMIDRIPKNNSDKSSHPEVFCKNGVLKNFAKFTRKHLCQSLFFNKVATLLKKILWHRCLLVNFAKFLRILFLQNTSDGCFSSDTSSSLKRFKKFSERAKGNIWQIPLLQSYRMQAWLTL